MALQLTTTWKGITLTNAYHKIIHTSGSKTSGLEVVMGVFTDALGECVYHTQEHIPADVLVHGPAVGDYLAQAYTHLKGREVSEGMVDYSTATDV